MAIVKVDAQLAAQVLFPGASVRISGCEAHWDGAGNVILHLTVDGPDVPDCPTVRAVIRTIATSFEASDG